MSSSSSYPFTFRVDHQLDSTPGSSSSSSAGQPRGRPLSKEDKRRLRQQRQADGELDDPSDGSRSRDEKKRGWIGWGQKDQDDRQDDGPPSKKRRGIAMTIVDSAISVALVGTAVGLTAYRMWRDRGKPVPPDELPRIEAPPKRPQILAAGPVESFVYARDHDQIDHSLEGESKVVRGSMDAPPAYYQADSFVTAPSTPGSDLAPRTSPFDQLYPDRPSTLATSNATPKATSRRPPLLPSTSSFLPPTGLDSHIDTLNSKLEQMMEEARLALSAPTSHFTEDPAPSSAQDSVLIQEELSDGGWRDLGAGGSGGRMRESFSMPSFVESDVHRGGAYLPRSSSATSAASNLSSSHKMGRSTTTTPKLGTHIAHTSQHGRRRSVASLPSSSSSTTLSTPMRYRRDLLVGQSSSAGGGSSRGEKDDVLFDQPETEEEQEEPPPPRAAGGGGNSLKEMLARTARSYGVTLTE